MKKVFLIIFFTFYIFIGALIAQVQIRGKFITNPNTASISLSDFKKNNHAIKLNRISEFSFKSEAVFHGFYQINNIGIIYLSKNYNLTIAESKAGKFIFTGKGALENNAIQSAKDELGTYLHLDTTTDDEVELAQPALYLEPADFLQKISEYKDYCKTLFNKSADSFFKKYAELDIEYYCRPFIQYYYFNYGKDKKISDEAFALLVNADTSSNPTATAKKYIELKEQSEKKKLTDVDRLLLHKLYSAAWDKNDEILFNNSLNYRNAFEDFFSTASLSGKYLGMPYNSSEDKTIMLLTILSDTVSNPYILNYFRFKFCSDIINKTKDTAIAGKYYRQFLSQNTRQGYAKEIAETYKIKIRYSSGMPAPHFVYKNTIGQITRSQSLLGRYVYIDVWATWCGPCVKEIPYLQKLESEYKGRNIQFVSISVDKAKDKIKWKDYVIKNKLGGIQLIADNDFESLFIKNMGIDAIPRFILIDPDGKLVEANALRPSDEKLKKLFDLLL